MLCIFAHINRHTHLYININIITNIYINMKVSKVILEKILKDNSFSVKLAETLNITQLSVRNLAKRNSDKLTLYIAIKFYKEQGFSEEEIFAKEEEKETI